MTEKRYAAIVDVETTGLSPREDEITEIGILQFCYRGLERPVITKSFGAIQQVSKALTPEIQKITGLCDDTLQGEKIAWAGVRKILAGVDYVIAHNAAFDRSFLKRAVLPDGSKLFDGMEVRWACSRVNIDWEEKGFKTTALNYLACDHGFLNPFAHRALFDCAITYKLILPYLEELFENANQPRVRIFAWKAPFAAKDKIKGRGFHWNAEKKVWFKECLKTKAAPFLEFLEAEVYVGVPWTVKTEDIVYDDDD